MAWDATKYCAEGVWSVSGRFGRSVQSMLTPFVPVRDQAFRIYVLGSFIVYEVGTTFVAVGLEEGMKGAKRYGEVGGKYGEIIGEFVAPLIAKMIKDMLPFPIPINILGTQVSMDDLRKVGMKVNHLVHPLVTSNMVIDVFKQYPSQFSNICTSLPNYSTMPPDESILPSANLTPEGEKIDSDSYKQMYLLALASQAPEIGRYLGGVIGYGIGAASGFIIWGLKGGISSVPGAVIRGLIKGRQRLDKEDPSQKPNEEPSTDKNFRDPSPVE